MPRWCIKSTKNKGKGNQKQAFSLAIFSLKDVFFFGYLSLRPMENPIAVQQPLAKLPDVFRIEATRLSKRYAGNWIFEELNHTFHFGRPTALIGANGSGKSTLLQVLAGFIPASGGKLKFFKQGQELKEHQMFQQVAMATPYMELPEDLGVAELVEFHFQLVKPLSRLVTADLLKEIDLFQHRDKQVKFLSSGMKQRLKLAIAFHTDSPCLLLDEPTTHLDKFFSSWYQQQVDKLVSQRLIIIASNIPEEYACCVERLHISRVITKS